MYTACLWCYSLYPHQPSWKNMPDHGRKQNFDSIQLARCWYKLTVTPQRSFWPKCLTPRYIKSGLSNVLLLTLWTMLSSNCWIRCSNAQMTTDCEQYSLSCIIIVYPVFHFIPSMFTSCWHLKQVFFCCVHENKQIREEKKCEINK